MKTIPLARSGKFALVDDADYDAVSQFKWYVVKKGRVFYARREIFSPDGKRTSQYLHQFLMPGAPEVHHRDGDGLNNQRDNIRSVTHQQNLQGACHKRPGATSKFRGVYWCNRQKWKAQIRVDGKNLYLGKFVDEAAAARAYDVAARKYFGEFASPNFPLDPNSNPNYTRP